MSTTPVTLRDLAAQVRSGQLAGDALVKPAADQIERRNGPLNALVSSRSADALAESAHADWTDRTLAGIPFTVKDMLATADLPTTCGSRTLEDWSAGVDATAVARMRAAGAVLMGKSNCPEFALGVDTNNELFGRTFNPLGEWTPGGSSGGEAAAIAAGMSLVGLGSDYGGSIRWPAQCAGLVGLRPTVGRVPRSGEQPTLPGSDPLGVEALSFQDAVQVIGPLGRCIDDLHTALSVISGPDGIDPIAVDEPLGDYREVDPSDVEVRWGTHVGNVPVDPEVVRTVFFAVESLRSLGTRVQEGLPDAVNDGLKVYDLLRAADAMGTIAAVDTARPGLIGAPVRAMLENRTAPGRAEQAELWEHRNKIVAKLRQWLTGDRALILPVSVDIPRDLRGDVANFRLLTPSRAISLFGFPSLSVPVATARSGAPISVQVVAPPFREDLALAIGAALEQASGWGRTTTLKNRIPDAN
ncbi:amidase [Arthrobacter gyeryongensis]|uniref:Amidase n=1 Tax=Arthrobacter gyeryongensis TaxID=1650592 RepID=A0ABP9SMK8_9MICC